MWWVRWIFIYKKTFLCRPVGLYVCPPVYLSVYFVRLSICLPVYFVRLFVCLSLCICRVCLFLCLFVFLAVWLLVYLSVCLCVCVFVYLSFSLSLCLSVCFSVYSCASDCLLFFCLFLNLTVCMHVCLSASLFDCLSVCLSVSTPWMLWCLFCWHAEAVEIKLGEPSPCNKSILRLPYATPLWIINTFTALKDLDPNESLCERKGRVGFLK